MKKFEIYFNIALVFIDFLMIYIAGTFTFFFRHSNLIQSFKPAAFEIPYNQFLTSLILTAVLWIIVFAFNGLYNLKVTRSVTEEIFKVLSASLIVFALIATFLMLSRTLFDSRFIIILGWILAVLAIMFFRVAVKKLQQYLVGKYNFARHNVLLVGKTGSQALYNLEKELSRTPRFGYEVVGKINEISLDKIERLFREKNINELFLTDLNFEKKDILELVSLCFRSSVAFNFVPVLFETFKTQTHTLSTMPLVQLVNTSLGGWGKIFKRLFDLIISILLLPFFLLLYLLVAFFIKIDSPGPVIVKLARVGQDGKIFYLYKFRSMIKNAHEFKNQLLHLSERSGPLFKLKNDPRITRVGKFLRRFRIDEVPQLINVLKGEMSLVGPRPHEPEEVQKYLSYQKRLLAIKPGITGLAQISGASDLPFEKEVELDIYYIENWSLLFDIKILIRTVFKIFFDPSAV